MWEHLSCVEGLGQGVELLLIAIYTFTLASPGLRKRQLSGQEWYFLTNDLLQPYMKELSRPPT